MRNIKAIAQNTFRETIRDRILYVIVIFAALMIGASLLAGSISLDQDVKVVKDFGLGSIFIFSVIMTVFIGTNLVHKEIDKRTIFLILSKPIKRSEFIIGKFSGLALTMLVILSLMAVFFMGLVRIKTGGWSPILLEAIALNYVELLILIALTIVFSSFTAPLSSALYTFFIFIIGHSMSALAHVIKTTDSAFIRLPFQFVYYAFPNLEKYNIRNSATYGIGLSGEQTGLVLLYAAFYCIFLVSIAIWVLKKQDY